MLWCLRFLRLGSEVWGLYPNQSQKGIFYHYSIILRELSIDEPVRAKRTVILGVKISLRMRVQLSIAYGTGRSQGVWWHQHPSGWNINFCANEPSWLCACEFSSQNYRPLCLPSSIESSLMFCWEPEGRYRCTESMATAPFWFSTEHRWTVLMPFWLSTDDKTPDN